MELLFCWLYNLLLLRQKKNSCGFDRTTPFSCGQINAYENACARQRTTKWFPPTGGAPWWRSNKAMCPRVESGTPRKVTVIMTWSLKWIRQKHWKRGMGRLNLSPFKKKFPLILGFRKGNHNMIPNEIDIWIEKVTTT